MKNEISLETFRFSTFSWQQITDRSDDERWSCVLLLVTDRISIMRQISDYSSISVFFGGLFPNETDLRSILEKNQTQFESITFVDSKYFVNCQNGSFWT